MTADVHLYDTARRLGDQARAQGVTIDLDNGQPMDIYALFQAVEGRDYDPDSHRDELAILVYARAFETPVRPTVVESGPERYLNADMPNSIDAADDDASLVLEATPGDWRGTFAVLVRALVDDLASDGLENLPHVVVTDEHCNRYYGVLWLYDEARDVLVFDDGRTLPVDTVTRIAV